MSLRARDRTTFPAVVLGAAGAAALVLLVRFQSLPRPLWLWGALAAAYVALEYAAVEVGDRLLVSSAVAVAFGTAVVMGPQSGVLAVALMAALALVHPSYFARRRWTLPVANFGQLVLSSTVGVGLLAALLPAGPVTRAAVPRILAATVPAALAYDWVNFYLVAFMTRRLYPDRPPEAWSALRANHLAMTLLAVVGSLAGAAYLLVGPVILPLVGLTFVAGHVGFASYARVRRAHLDTVHGFVKAVEALDPYTRGHTDRVLHLVSVAGTELGLDPGRMERLRSAALLHDVGKLAVPAALLRRTEPLGPAEEAAVARHMRVVEDLLAGIDVLAPAVRLIEESHRVAVGGRGSVEARVLAVADSFDGMTSTRSYRAALTQAEAFARLRERAAALGGEVVEALIGGITRRGEAYGAPDDASAAEVARLVKERALRA
ncbi:MAG: HD domain-containing protein [Actinobacteria bacterium]|nr:HD domain-containing protein [Actinomycetota bacterium]